MKDDHFRVRWWENWEVKAYKLHITVKQFFSNQARQIFRYGCPSPLFVMTASFNPSNFARSAQPRHHRNVARYWTQGNEWPKSRRRISPHTVSYLLSKRPRLTFCSADSSSVRRALHWLRSVRHAHPSIMITEINVKICASEVLVQWRVSRVSWCWHFGELTAIVSAIVKYRVIS